MRSSSAPTAPDGVAIAVDTGDGTVSVFHNRHGNRNQNGVVDIRTVETHVVDTRNGVVLVVVDIRTVEMHVVDTRNGAVLVVVDIRTVGAGASSSRMTIVDNFLIRLLLHFPCPYFWRSSR